jgi:hypothetical protein
MRIVPVAPGRALHSVAAALLLSCAAGSVFANPDEAADPVLKLLADKGVVVDSNSGPERHAAKPGLLRQVGDRAAGLTVAAMEFVGVRYRRGGTSAATGFDCSGFTRHVVETSLGLVLPRRADEQASAPGLVAVDRKDLKPGDLVFFNTLKRTFSHVGIYVGGNKFIHSPRPGQSVRTEDMGFAYWAKRFTGARRLETTVAIDRDEIAAAPEGGGT